MTKPALYGWICQDVTQELEEAAARKDQDHAIALGHLLETGACECDVVTAKEVRYSAALCGYDTDWDWAGRSRISIVIL